MGKTITLTTQVIVGQEDKFFIARVIGKEGPGEFEGEIRIEKLPLKMKERALAGLADYETDIPGLYQLRHANFGGRPVDIYKIVWKDETHNTGFGEKEDIRSIDIAEGDAREMLEVIELAAWDPNLAGRCRQMEHHRNRLHELRGLDPYETVWTSEAIGPLQGGIPCSRGMVIAAHERELQRLFNQGVPPLYGFSANDVPAVAADFTNVNARQLAALIHKRFQCDLPAAVAGWNRLMQANITVEVFQGLLES